MTFTDRKLHLLISIPLLALALSAVARAQDAPADAPAVDAAEDDAAAPETAADAEPAPEAGTHSGHEVRSDLGAILRQHPPELATILALDPALLSNAEFLAGYPDLARFVAEHPEVRRSRFYLADFPAPHDRSDFGDVVEMMTIFSVFLVMTLGVAWLLRTIIEQKRWSRLTRTQSEVHNKILERFGTSEALLEYMRSPAGTKFLESAPIPLRAEAPVQNAPIARSLWSIQIGVVVAAGAVGMLIASGRLDRDAAEGFFTLGVIGLCVGAGFVLSAVVALFLSRRLGLWEGPAARRDELDEASLRG
jgi:hypothetical protein